MDGTSPGESLTPTSRSQDHSHVAARTARGILIASLLCFLVITLLNILSAPHDAYDLPVLVTCLLLLFGLQLVHSAPNASAAPTRTKMLTLAAQGVLTYLPFVWLGVFWGAMAGFFAASLLLLLPPRAGWTLYGLTVLSLLIPATVDGRGAVDTFYMCQSTALTGLVVYGLSRLTSLVDQLHRARADLARLAVSNEQLRFARDLHDLLGYSLSAVSLKNELIRRLIPTNPHRACEEVDEVLVISRQALADVRRVATGYRQMSLRSEVTSAESVLAAAGVSVTVDVEEAIEHLTPATSTVLATVLREGVTNLLRHSKASYCWISAHVEEDVARLTITNDGLVLGHHPPAQHSGSGLGNLERRLEDVGGRLLVRRVPDDGDTGEFRLIAEAPVREAKAPNPDATDIADEERPYDRTDSAA